tara:strand:- start:32855 stop:33751 length:897 start_codon:yes stop_codon:yes gene_type:complete
MKNFRQQLQLPLAMVMASLILAGCTQLSAPEGSAEVRSKLTRLQANQELASRAPVSIKEAEEAVRAAEVPEKDSSLAEHRVLMADRKVEIAAAQARARLYEDQREDLRKESEKARLDARTREVERARQEAGLARGEADRAQEEAERARREAGLARGEAEAARLKQEELQRQLEELDAKQTARGMVVTLGDVLFETGRAELTGSAPAGLSKLADFLGEYPDRSIAIEGHTDSVGTEAFNFTLSQRRAAAVQTFLANQGVAQSRMRAVGKGESSPIASNDSSTGRQQNRRVEVIIENPQQ